MLDTVLASYAWACRVGVRVQRVFGSAMTDMHK